MTASRIFRAIGCPLSGAGKTTWLSAQSQIAAAKHGGSSVQIVSLTKTAAAEIGSRDTSIPAENCSTLHAACYRALDSPDIAETRVSMREFAAAHPELAADDPHGTDPLEDDAIGDPGGSSLHAACQNHRARMTPREQWSPDEVAYDTAWQAFCQETGRMDFTALLERCLHGEITPITEPRVLLADEVQDMSTLEFALLRMWSQSTDTTVCVGDEAQALYGWRGSDTGGLSSLDVTGQRLLTQSYRCSQSVRDAALGWMHDNGHPVVDWQPTDETGTVSEEPFALCDTDDLLDALAGITGSGQATTATTVAILTTCGYMLDPTIAALRDAGIPFANVHRLKEQRWNPTRGKVFDAMRAYLRTSPQVHGEASGPRTWGDLLAWTSLITAKDNLARGAKAAIEEHCRPDQFKQTRAGEIVPIDVLLTLLGNPVHPALRNDVHWLRDALQAKHQRMGDYATRVYDRDPRGLVDEPRLTIGTIHASKGATYDRVLLAPELSKEGYYGDQGWLGAGRDSIVRLAYVGVTRARTGVHLLEPASPEYIPIADVFRETRAA